MSPSIDRGPSLSTRHPASARRRPAPSAPSASSARGSAFVGGAVAAGLGLGALAVVVLLLWVASPYPSGGPDIALHLAADLWLLAHGADLVRTQTLSGTPAPIGVTPLLLTALPAWLLYRVARRTLTRTLQAAPPPDHPEIPETPETLEPFEPFQGSTPPTAAPVPETRTLVGWLLAGYLVVAAATTCYASSGPLRVEPLSAILYVPFVAAVTVVAATWRTFGRHALSTSPLPAPLRRVWSALPPGARVVLGRRRLVVALRAATTGIGVLVLGGAVLATVALVRHLGAAYSDLLGLAQDWAGRLTVLLLSLALLPNAALWAAAYGLGPGFTLGGGSTVGPPAAGSGPVLPRFPLLAAVPEEGAGTPLTWAAVAVAVIAGASVAWRVARPATGTAAAAEVGRDWRATASTAALAAVACGAATAFLAAPAGGSLGTEALADFGPNWWLTGAAALGWTALIGVPGALAVRAWWPAVPRNRAPLSTGGGGAAADALRPTWRARLLTAARALRCPVDALKRRAGAVARLPRFLKRPTRASQRPISAPERPADVTKRHARHARERRPLLPSLPQSLSFTRTRRARRPQHADDWHNTEARQARWARLRVDSSRAFLEAPDHEAPVHEAPEVAPPPSPDRAPRSAPDVPQV